MKKIILLITFLFLTSSAAFAQSFTPDTLYLKLADAIDKALNYNDKLLSSKKQIEKSSYAIDEVKSFQYPQIDLLFSYNYLDIVPGFKAVTLGNIEHDFFPRINLEQAIYLGGKIENSIRLKEELMRGKEYSHKEQEQQIKFILSSYYYQLKAVRNQISILENNKEQLEIQKKLSRLLIDAGKLSELEIGRIEVDLAYIDGIMLKLENDYNSISHNILLLMGSDSYFTIIPVDSLKVEDDLLSFGDAISSAIAINPSIKKYESSIKQSEINTELQKAARLPQIGASAYYGYEFGLEKFSFDKNDRYFVGLNAKLPLFDGGNITSKIQQAAIDIESAKYEMNYFVKQLSIMIDQTNRKISEIKEQIDIQKKSVQQLKETYRLAFLEYQAGRRSNTDLLDIQKNLLNAEVILNDLQINYILKQTELKYYCGIL